MATILTYPVDVKYPTNITNFRKAVRDVNTSGGGGMPTYNNISVSSSSQGSWENSGGGYTGGNVNDIYSRRPVSDSYAGFQFKGETSSNGLEMKKYIDIGDGGLRYSGSSFSASYKSSHMNNVTSCWGILNAYGMQSRNSCHGVIDKIGLRLRHYSRSEILIVQCTQKLGSYQTVTARYAGAEPIVFGYGVPSDQLSHYTNSGYRFLGFRLQLRLSRAGSGTKTDALRIGITGLTPGFGDYNNRWDATAKRIICRQHDTAYSNANRTYYIEAG